MRASGLSLVLMGAVLLGGCTGRQPAPAEAVAPVTPVPKPGRARGPLVEAGGVEIEKVPFRTGVSSATVERLAKEQGCTGGQGAGLITEPGPVEIYRMQCADGQVFMARCELRQCTKM